MLISYRASLTSQSSSVYPHCLLFTLNSLICLFWPSHTHFRSRSFPFRIYHFGVIVFPYFASFVYALAVSFPRYLIRFRVSSARLRFVLVLYLSKKGVEICIDDGKGLPHFDFHSHLKWQRCIRCHGTCATHVWMLQYAATCSCSGSCSCRLQLGRKFRISESPPHHESRCHSPIPDDFRECKNNFASGGGREMQIMR